MSDSGKSGKHTDPRPAGGAKESEAPAKGVASRRLATEVLIQVEKEGAYANLALAAGFKRKSLPERDRAFVTALVQGVLRHRGVIDERLRELSREPLEKLPATLRNILRLAVFQLEYMNDIPQRAVLDTANDLARSMGHPGQAKYANAVLRNCIRRQKPLEEAVVDIADAQQMAQLHSMPVWLVERWLENFGAEETRLLLEHSQKIPPLVLRTCETSITPEGLQEVFESRGIRCRRGRLVESCIIVEDRGPFKGPIHKLPGYDEGLFTVQDEAAAFVSIVVDPQPGELVVDLCAAPGGKSLHLGEMMENRGRVLAVDSHSRRLNLLRKNRQRIGLTNIEAVIADGTSFQPEAPPDRVLVDAPCTGTGVISRRADIRFQRELPDISNLVELQRSLLRHAASLVKPGGILVYSTCSIEPEENEQNFRWFLEEHEQFAAESLRPYVPPELAREWEAEATTAVDLDSGAVQLLPSRHGVSGFFICRLRKGIS